MIFTWWAGHQRDLPWRSTRDPYRIMVSEVMLQQTQVHRVVPKYEEFIKAFPTLETLAQASPAYVLRVWKGMGYNRRALYLHKAAKIIVEEYHGKFPVSEQDLVKLPGLGKYTARAILVFAYKQDVPLVDTNIRQIITFFIFKNKPQKESVIQDVARQLLPKGKSWQWHQALMDFGTIELSKINRSKRRDVPTGTSHNRRNAVPFRDSDRFFRGRIIDRLREGEVQQEKIIEEYISLYGKSRRFMCGIIASLIKDGLTQQASHGILRLPTE